MKPIHSTLGRLVVSNRYACALMALTLLVAGCSAREASAPGDKPVAVKEAAAADAPASDPADQPESAPNPETVGPEVMVVNTAKLAGLLNRTLGKVTVLNIWATWCVPCVTEMPDLVRFYNETDRGQIAFVSLSLNDLEDRTGAIPAFQKEHQIPFPVYVLNERNVDGMTKALRGPFNGGIPTTYIYDKTGKIVQNIEGPTTIEHLNTLIESITTP